MNKLNYLKRLSLHGSILVGRVIMIVAPVVGSLLWKGLKTALVVGGEAASNAAAKDDAYPYGKPWLDHNDLYPNGNPCTENYAYEQWDVYTNKNRIK